MPSSMNWVDGPGGGTPMSAANLDKLAVVADVATAGTPTGDAMIAAYAPKNSAPLNAKGFGCKGDGTTDDTAALQAAFTASAGRGLVIPPGTYLFSDTITIPSGAHIAGFSEADTTGTILRFTQLDGRPAFTNNSDNGLSFICVEHLQVISVNTVGTAGTGDAFKLYGLTNNSRFSNVYVRNFRGNAYNLLKKTNSSDLTACGNVVFDQCFVISCGGYAWQADGYVNATWNMCDVNSCMAGAFHFSNGVNNQAQITITGLWWEGSQTWSSLQPILLDNMASQVINLIGCNFQGFTSSTDVIKMQTTTVGSPSLIGCTGYNFTNWVNDVVNSALLTFTSRINYAVTTIATGVTAQGANAFTEVYNTAGTTNQRRYRISVSGNIMVLAERNDAGGAVRDILYANGASGQVEIVNAMKIDGSVGFYNTTPVGKQTISGSRGANAALASLLTALAALGLITDSTTA